VVERGKNRRSKKKNIQTKQKMAVSTCTAYGKKYQTEDIVTTRLARLIRSKGSLMSNTIV
jgi:hypothetical protein